MSLKSLIQSFWLYSCLLCRILKIVCSKFMKFFFYGFWVIFSLFTICSTLNDKILSHIYFNVSQISFVFKFACVCGGVCMWAEIEVKAICFSQFLFILRQLSRLNILNGSFFFWFLNVVFVFFPISFIFLIKIFNLGILFCSIFISQY